jgi:hypothetical protein
LPESTVTESVVVDADAGKSPVYVTMALATRGNLLVAGITLELGHDRTGKLELAGPYSNVVTFDRPSLIPASTHDPTPPTASV